MNERPPERADLDQLLNALLPFAKHMLDEQGAFFPFGGTMTATGEVELFAGYTGSESPPSAELVELLRAGMRSEAAQGRIRAAAVCYDATVRDTDGQASDAIVVALEHRAGDAVEIVVPYAMVPGGPSYGELNAGHGGRSVFG